MISKLCMILFLAAAAYSQVPPIEPGVSHDLAKWRAARYSDVRYKLNLTLEKMSPVLKGTIEIHVNVSEPPASAGGGNLGKDSTPIILDWRKIRGSESLSTISNVSINGRNVSTTPSAEAASTPPYQGGEFLEADDHLVFRDGVVAGENVIKLDFTSPILTSGSAITRYVDKEDGSEYIYSLFVPSDASTAFPVFDQPDLKARFTLDVVAPRQWRIPSNENLICTSVIDVVFGARDGSNTFDPELTKAHQSKETTGECSPRMFRRDQAVTSFPETKPISTYVLAFAAGPFVDFADPESGSEYITSELRERYKKWSENHSVEISASGLEKAKESTVEKSIPRSHFTTFYVRKSQAAKFRPHAAEVFRLNREGIKYLEQYFDYKFPFPKYDLVLIPEFPFGGMEHAGATFLKESSIIFPTEPTKNDHISRANVIFHEAAHQWFGDTVTMKWFDDLWLKEGFAEFMAYKTLEHVMPEANAWKVFYERNKRAAYLTDSTRGTTPIYQKIDNLSAAKSAYGNIVYRKAPSFLRQAEFYIGEDKFQTAVRAFLKKHEYANADWQDLVKELEEVGWKRPIDCMESVEDCKENEKTQRSLIQYWANLWVYLPGIFKFRVDAGGDVLPERHESFGFAQNYIQQSLIKSNAPIHIPIKFRFLAEFNNGTRQSGDAEINFAGQSSQIIPSNRDTNNLPVTFFFPNYQDYGYGIFLLDDKSRDYVLKNIQNEKDDFLRSMMWGSLWDSVREGELDPKEYVELVIKNLSVPAGRSTTRPAEAASTDQVGEQDETTVATLLGRVSTALNYYIPVDTQRVSSPTVRVSSPTVRVSSPTVRVSSPTVKEGATPNTSNIEQTATLRERFEQMLVDRMHNSKTAGERITFFRTLVNVASTENSKKILKDMLTAETQRRGADRSEPGAIATGSKAILLKTKDKFDIVSRLLILNDPDAPKLQAELEKTETSDDAERYAYAAKAGIATAENKAKYWKDLTDNKEISESWLEAALGPFNSLEQSKLTLPYLEKALKELPNLKRDRKIFFVNGWLGAFIGGQRSEEALNVINKFLADNPNLDNDLRLKILENADLIERAVKIRKRR